MRNLLGLSRYRGYFELACIVFAAAISFITAVVFGMAPALAVPLVSISLRA